MPGYIPRGTIPANLLPFTEDYAIDEPELRRHLRWLADVPGVTAITQNGHAAEVTSLSRDEQLRALTIALDEVGSRLPIIAGIFADGSLQAAALARDAEQEGASALLVAPPALFAWGVQQRPEMIYRHFATIAERTSLPLIAFQYPPAQGWGYTTEQLVMLAERVPAVVAIKDWSQDIVICERNIRALHALGRPFSVLTTYSAALYAALAIGADGLLSGMGSVVADLQAQLFAAVQRGDMVEARRLNDQLFPLAKVFYAPPFLDMHNRMKVALVELGRLRRAVVRPPLVPLDAGERAAIRAALAEAGLLAPAAAG